MPDASENFFYPTDPDEKERLSEHIAQYKYVDKHFSLPCEACGQTTPHAVAKLIDDGEFRYAIKCTNCGAVATVASEGKRRR
jgi:transcription elongation factor Elf1